MLSALFNKSITQVIRPVRPPDDIMKSKWNEIKMIHMYPGYIIDARFINWFLVSNTSEEHCHDLFTSTYSNSETALNIGKSTTHNGKC